MPTPLKNPYKKLHAAAIQQSITSWDKEKNFEVSFQLVKKAAHEGAELIVLPELHATPYFCQEENTHHFDLAEPIPGPSTDILSHWAKTLDIVLVGSVFERRAAGIYHNTAVVLDKAKGLIGKYRKMHIPDDPDFYEKFYFTPGDNLPFSASFKPIKTSVGNLGVLICWDQWYPEAARLSALQGADLLIYPTAIGWDPDDSSKEQALQLNAWKVIQQSHAIANHIPVIVANRTGLETNSSKNTSGINFWGNSFITGAQGEILASTKNISSQKTDSQDQIVNAHLDFRTTENNRRIWPFLRDRRIDAYEGLLKRYLA